MKVLNFGSLNIDYTYSVAHFVREGETLSSEQLQVFSGGKGLNQSIALSKSGADVWHAGAVGREDGCFLVEQLEKAGVHTEYIAKLDGQTGHAIIQKNHDGNNGILLYGGANQRITRAMIDSAMETFGEGDFLVLQNEISEIGYIMEKAYARGMRIVLNPSPMNPKVLTYPLNDVQYFLLNEIEAADLCGCAPGDGKPENLLKDLAARFPQAVIVLTLGGDGSLLWDGTRMIRQKAYPVIAVDTTAAGDTFTGYLIGSLVQGKTTEEALCLAAKAAAIAVSRHGAAPSIPERMEVETFSIV